MDSRKIYKVHVVEQSLRNTTALPRNWAKKQKEKYLRNTARNTTAPPTRNMLLPIPPSSSSLVNFSINFDKFSGNFFQLQIITIKYFGKETFLDVGIKNSLFCFLVYDVEFEKDWSNLFPENHSVFIFQILYCVHRISSVFHLCQIQRVQKSRE